MSFHHGSCNISQVHVVLNDHVVGRQLVDQLVHQLRVNRYNLHRNDIDHCYGSCDIIQHQLNQICFLQLIQCLMQLSSFQCSWSFGDDASYHPFHHHQLRRLLLHPYHRFYLPSFHLLVPVPSYHFQPLVPS
jgi:hypothetical protein